MKLKIYTLKLKVPARPLTAREKRPLNSQVGCEARLHTHERAGALGGARVQFCGHQGLLQRRLVPVSQELRQFVRAGLVSQLLVSADHQVEGERIAIIFCKVGQRIFIFALHYQDCSGSTVKGDLDHLVVGGVGH